MYGVVHMLSQRMCESVLYHNQACGVTHLDVAKPQFFYKWGVSNSSIICVILLKISVCNCLVFLYIKQVNGWNPVLWDKIGLAWGHSKDIDGLVYNK